MGTLSLQRRFGGAVPGLAGWALLAGVALWSLFAVNATLGVVRLDTPETALLVLSVPLALAGIRLTRRAPAGAALRVATSWSLILLGALAGAIAISADPVIVFVIPVVAVSAVICRRRPAGAVITALFFTGSFNTVEAFTPIPVGETVDLILAGLWCGVIWTWVLGRRDEVAWVWPGVALTLVYLSILATFVLFSDDVFRGLFGFRASAWYMAAFLLIAYARWDAVTYRRIAFGFVGIAALVGGYATFRWIVGPADAEAAIALSFNAQYQYVNDELRLFGSFPGGKELAAWTAVTIPFCTAFALTFRDRWRIVAAAAVGLCGVGLLGSEARAGFVAAIAGLALVLVLYQFSRGVPGLHLGVTAAAVIAILGVGVVLFSTTAGSDEASAERYEVLTRPGDDPAFQARLFKWETALDEIDTKPLGHGIGTAGMAEQRYRRFTTIASSNLDNSYLKVAYEHGMLVMGLFIATLVTLLAGLARRAAFTLDRERAGLAIGGAGSLIALMVLMFSGMYIEGLPALAAWLLVGLGVAQFTRGERAGRAAASA